MGVVIRRTIAALSIGLGVLASQAAPAFAQALSGVGIVLMHGKTGMPSGPIEGLAATLRKQGAVVLTPEMPWSRKRIYDASYEQAMGDIGRAVTDLRKRGLTRIVIAGQSIGANAAIGYGVRHDDIAGIIAIAPGHNPGSANFLKHTEASVEKARKQVAAGRGGPAGAFVDFNQGRVFDVRASARVYLSYLDPNGPANMGQNAKAMKAVPFLLAIGRQDQLYPRARSFIFEPAAKSPKSKFVEVGGGHMDTMRIAADEIVNWLKSL
jgi:dienelactone hydrolase